MLSNLHIIEIPTDAYSEVAKLVNFLEETPDNVNEEMVRDSISASTRSGKLLNGMHHLYYKPSLVQKNTAPKIEAGGDGYWLWNDPPNPNYTKVMFQKALEIMEKSADTKDFLSILQSPIRTLYA